jgi:translocation protein SEC63
MSSFSDNFTRDENKETQYDDSAFYSFAGTILLVSIIPLIYFILKRIFYKKAFTSKNYKNCECINCLQRLHKHNEKIKKNKFNFTFYFMIFMVIVLSYLFYLSYFEIVKNGSNFKRFDPYEILEIEVGTEEKAIKKAYRRLSLKYHPDKNPNNLQAKAKFIMIAKAYEALTDEVGRKNYEQFGNPDGPGSMRLAVGLPSFVLNKKNHMPILILFLIFIVVVIPAFVWFWFSNSNKYDDSGMILDSQKIFFEFLNENILLKQMPFVLGASLEFSKMKIRPDEADELARLWKTYKDQMPKFKEELMPFSNKKAICLIYAYLNKYKFNSEKLNEDLDDILSLAPNLLNNMYAMCIQVTQLKLMNPNFPKNFGYRCIRTVLEFAQIINHKLPLNRESSPFLQLPGFTEEKIKEFKKSKGVDLKVSTLPAFMELNFEQRASLLKCQFSNDEISEIEKSISQLPKYSLKVEKFVDGFEEILFEDMLTIKVTIERSNLPEDKVIFFNLRN